MSTRLLSFFSTGKADINVIKTCALHMDERLKEVNGSEERSVVVVVVIVVAVVQIASKNLESEYHKFILI